MTPCNIFVNLSEYIKLYDYSIGKRVYLYQLLSSHNEYNILENCGWYVENGLFKLKSEMLEIVI